MILVRETLKQTDTDKIKDCANIHPSGIHKRKQDIISEKAKDINGDQRIITY